MKTQKGLNVVCASGATLIEALDNATSSTVERVLTTFGIGSGPKQMQMKNTRSIVNAISASGEGLPTEKAVADAVNWIEVGRFTARQSGSGNKYDFIALKNAGYKYARVRENRTGGFCGADIDLSKVTMSTQIKLIDMASFWSSSRIDIISITQHSADVTSGDFIFYKASITISGSSATYALKNSGQTETLIVEARK